jgi:YD repeat-containing protein
MKWLKQLLLSAFFLPTITQGNELWLEEFNDGTVAGVPYGLTYESTPTGRGARFTRLSESRLQYPYAAGMPRSGTIELRIKVDSAYRYNNYSLSNNESCALIFTTDVAGGDVTYPGSAWFYVCNNGDITISVATAKYGATPPQVLIATATAFRFGEWHTIGFSFGSDGQAIAVDGGERAFSTINTQQLGAGGNHSTAIDQPTLGESTPGYWRNNQYDGGFEGVIDTFRASNVGRDWALGNNLPIFPGLSCTTNTPGLPLDQTACFYDSTDYWRQAILKKAGEVVAKASLAGNEGGFCAGNLLWLDAADKPISNWSGLFGMANTVAVEISAERTDGTTRVLASRTATRSQLAVAVTADGQSFPMNGPQAVATFTAIPFGGTAPYTYAWTEVLDYLEGYGDNDWGTTASATIELPAYGEKYPSYPARWGAANDLHPVNLRVTDSAGMLATVQCLAAVTNPHLNGNPGLSGSGSQLLRGVDLASGNYHLSATDLSVSGKGPDFVLTRAYNSNVAGNGAWTFNLDLSLYFSAHSMGREITLGPREDGREQRYYREMDGTWHALNPGNFDALKQEADGRFVLYTQGNLLYRFAAPAGAEAGRLEAIADRDGNVLSFSYNTDNQITGATDAGGRAYTIARVNGRITGVTDFSGRSVGYTWNADGMLTEVRNPRGQTTKYAYTTGSAPADRFKLVSITDPRDKVQTRVAYHSTTALLGKVASVTDGAGSQWGYQYTSDTGRQMTGVTRPAVNGVNNNLAFALDDARTRVLERIDALNVGDYRSRTTFKSTTTRTRIAELALPIESYRPNNAKTTIVYQDDGAGNPDKITDALARETAATWGTVSGQTNLTPLASVKRPGVTTTTRYSGFSPGGKAQTIVDPLEQSTLRTYDTTGQLIQTTDARGNATAIVYDAQGQPTRITDALGNVTETTYDTLGRVLTERDARGAITRYTYDANGNRLTATDALGGVTTNTYDAADNLVSTRDPRGSTTTFVYDDLSRKIEERYTVGGQQRVRAFVYDAMGRLARVTNEKGHSSDTRFDARGKVLQEINPLSETIAYTYDENGNVLTVTDAEGRRITNAYDLLDRKTRVTDALGNDEAYTYNDQGLLASRRDARGQTTGYSYDAIGQMTRVTDPNGGQTSATYDANGNLAGTTDPKGQTTAYTYDALDRLIRLTDATGRHWDFTYDANGNRLTHTLPSGQVIGYAYDVLDRVTRVTYPGGPTVDYTYDANSNRLTMTDANGTTRYAYDEQNRLTSVTDAFGNAVAYGYDAAGQLQQLTYPGNRAVSYNRDAAGRLTSLADWLSHTTTYTRDRTGAVTAILYGNGARVQKGYDAVGRLTSLFNRTAANTIISSHTLRLDGLGNPLSADLELPLEPANLGKSAEALYDGSLGFPVALYRNIISRISCIAKTLWPQS